MAMVTARRGQHTVKVSKHSYETLFRKRGYKLVNEEVETNIPDMDAEQVVGCEESEEQGKEQEIETIPISEMNKEQLAEYAKEHNIDTSGARNVREARQIIQKAIREQKM